ncbi:MAG: HNH endonuclease signature motif containing protein [Cyanobacteria bacterium J06648_10]
MPRWRPKPAQRAIVSQRAGGCCEYCRSQERYSPDTFSVEHILPVSKEGSNELSNLAFSCQGCNNRKYVSVFITDPVTQALVAIYHHRKQAWNDHFAWNGDFTSILGLTATGRATVEKLQLNRRGLVNLRGALYKLKEHPPII